MEDIHDRLRSQAVRLLAEIAYYELVDDWWQKSRVVYSEDAKIWQDIKTCLGGGRFVLTRGEEENEKIMDLLESLYQANHRIPVEKAREIYLHFLAKNSRKAFLFYYFFDRTYRSPELITFLSSLPEAMLNDDYVREKLRECQSEIQ